MKTCPYCLVEHDRPGTAVYCCPEHARAAARQGAAASRRGRRNASGAVEAQQARLESAQRWRDVAMGRKEPEVAVAEAKRKKKKK